MCGLISCVRAMPLPKCSHGTQRCFHWLCSVLAYLGGYAYAGGWHTAGVLFWHSLYVGVCRALQRRDDDGLARGRGVYWGTLLESYPRWSYVVSLLNGGIIMPAMLWCAARAATPPCDRGGCADSAALLAAPP